jgi:beta-glucosidase
LRDLLDDVDVVHERGCEIERSPRPLGAAGLRAPGGFTVEVFAMPDRTGRAVVETSTDQLRLVWFEPPVDGLAPNAWSARARGFVVAGETGVYRLALAQSGRARLFVDGALVLDGVATPPPPGGSDVFGFISQDLVAEVVLDAGRPTEVVLEYSSTEATIPCVRAGFRLPDDPRLLDRAVDAARSADAAVVVVGTSSEWESEGHDRGSFSLPGDQDELVRRVAAANANTIVLVNAGSAVDLSWSQEVAAVLQCWFGGEEMADAIADVLCGVSEPGGRLPMTVPMRVEHSPSWDNFPGENGTVRYGEGLFMGYRGHEHRAVEPRFPFGHGLGYTTFALGEPELSSSSFTPGGALTVRVPVSNTGRRTGSEVVQLYVEPGEARLARPPKELRAFARVTLDPGQSATVELVLDDRAFAYWDPGQADWDEMQAQLEGMTTVQAHPPHERREPGWQVDAGRYHLHVGRSSADISRTVEVDVRTP